MKTTIVRERVPVPADTRLSRVGRIHMLGVPEVADIEPPRRTDKVRDQKWTGRRADGFVATGDTPEECADALGSR